MMGLKALSKASRFSANFQTLNVTLSCAKNSLPDQQSSIFHGRLPSHTSQPKE
jgi:hypothetical protein